MDIEILAWIASFFAMALVIISYFVRKKEKYLLFQLLGILLLIASYFFSLDWLAVLGLSVARVANDHLRFDVPASAAIRYFSSWEAQTGFSVSFATRRYHFIASR